MSFEIRGYLEKRLVVATRLRAASAVVLAARWQAAGVGQISVTFDGRPYGIEEFRQRFVLRANRSSIRPLLGDRLVS